MVFTVIGILAALGVTWLLVASGLALHWVVGVGCGLGAGLFTGWHLSRAETGGT